MCVEGEKTVVILHFTLFIPYICQICILIHEFGKREIQISLILRRNLANEKNMLYIFPIFRYEKKLCCSL